MPIPQMMMPDLVDVSVESDDWQHHDLNALAQRFCGAVLDHFGYDRMHFEISLLGCDDAKITELNHDFREKPAPTNVLSWPSVERASPVPGHHPDRVVGDANRTELGDIAIAFGVCRTEAMQAAKPFEQHAGHLLVHATLHLLGYDHIVTQDAHLMENIELQVLATLGQPDPYGDD